jgi:hypothetical protein
MQKLPRAALDGQVTQRLKELSRLFDMPNLNTFLYPPSQATVPQLGSFANVLLDIYQLREFSGQADLRVELRRVDPFREFSVMCCKLRAKLQKQKAHTERVSPAAVAFTMRHMTETRQLNVQGIFSLFFATFYLITKRYSFFSPSTQLRPSTFPQLRPGTFPQLPVSSAH